MSSLDLITPEIGSLKKSKGIPYVVRLDDEGNPYDTPYEDIKDDVVYVGKRYTMGGWDCDASIYGNANKLSRDDYIEWALDNEQIVDSLPLLSGKILVCWCVGKKGKDWHGCHALAIRDMFEMI